ncbi:MAG: hypothetical protein HY869_21855 [Chloroflexi bacterium]|nr:hypothetical protein [Chloroflexota bacterium]
MSRKPLEIIRGLALFIVLWVIALTAVRLQLIFPRTVLIWLSQSPNPQQAVIAFGAFISSGVLGLLRLGIEIPTIKPLVASEKVRTYITGLPFWVISVVFAFSVVGLLVVFPACSPPTSIQFFVQGRPDPFQPGDTLTASAGETLTLTAQSTLDDAILSCKWQYSGDAFEMLGSTNGCETSVKMARTEGNGYLTLQAAQNFCNQSAAFSLIVQVEPK